MRDVFLALPFRTPVTGRGGALAGLDAYELAAAVLRRQMASMTGVAMPDRVLLACVATPGNVARTAALAAGLPTSTPALTINEQCSGGLAAIRLAVEAVRAGAADLVLAGGTETASRSAVALDGGDDGRPRVAHAPRDVADPDMGPAADATARALWVSREEQDRYADQSYQRAARAIEERVFAPYIVPAGEPITTRDDIPHRLPRLDRLLRYPPAFGPDGTVTAGNAAAHADGAAAVLAGTAEALEAAGVRPLARVRSATTAAGDTALPALAIVPAIAAASSAAGIAAADVDAWEINEAFAVKIVACIRRFGLDEGRVNRYGGAIAYGHPFSASGAIIMVHLLAQLERGEGRIGVAAVAGAGGMGEAMLVEGV